MQRMWISEFSIRNPVVTSVITLALVVFGAISLLLLDTDEYPDVDPPVVAVRVPYPGASPQTVEREVVNVLEDAFASIGSVDRISSTSADSLALIVVEFLFDKDLQQASQDIRDAISEVRNELPAEMEEPILTRFDPNDLPIVSLTLSSARVSRSELTRIADPGIGSALRGVEGVADVRIVGGRERELIVELDPDALRASDVGVAQVVQAVQAQNLAAPVGRIVGATQERTIRLRGRIEDPRAFEELVISRPGEQVVRLGQVARVRAGSGEPRSSAFFAGEPAVGIDVIKADGYSTTAVSERVLERTAELAATLQAGVELRTVRDTGIRVRQSVHDVQLSLLEGAVLTVVVVFFFLNSWRSTVITGLALPVSVLASFIAVLALGFTLNTMSLLGLSLAIGILIDDAIVVRENIVRHMQMGKDHVRAAREGTAEIGLAVAATTFSIVVVFVPVAFMGGIAQQWFAPFALTIVCSVLVSLWVSFSLDPMLSSIWPDPAIEQGARNRVARAVDRFNAWIDRRTGDYRRVIAWALGHRVAVAAIALSSFVIALALPALGVIGSEFFPEEDRSEIVLELEAPPGSNLAYMEAKALQAAAIARARDDVAYTYTTIGGETGESVDSGNIYVRLVPKDERALRQSEIAQALRRSTARVFGLTTSLATGSFGEQKQIQLELEGRNLEVLAGLSRRIAEQVRQVEGVVDVGLSSKGQAPELEVEIDRALAGELGVSVAQVAQALRPAFAGVDAGDWVDERGETRDVVVRLARGSRAGPSDLERLPLVATAPDGQPSLVPLGQIAQVQAGLGPARIEHIDRERVIRIQANTAGRPLSEVVQDIEQRLAGVALPAGYTLSQGGETEEQQEVFGRILLALGVAALLMYMILVIQFGSFLDPIAIMASLPLSLIGVMLALLVTGSTLNIMSMIGMILLMGIVAKNAILLIDFAKWAEGDGLPRKRAIIEAGGVRLRPIVMTSLAIIAGMTPIAIGVGEGADFRAPLGRAVIGGVLTSTLLTLLVIPTFYDVLAAARERTLDRIRRKLHRPRALP